MRRVAQVAVRATCRLLVRIRLHVRVEGLEHVPPDGPALIVARHFHYGWDGIVLLAAVQRFVHFMVALDWVRNRAERRLMERACRLLGWPAIIRHDSLPVPGVSPFRREESRRYLSRALRQSVALLHSGRVLVIFPEAYPNVDPVFTRKEDDDAFLPFRPGFLRLVEWAERDGRPPIPIVPAGLRYTRGARWEITLSFGPALFAGPPRRRDLLLRQVEEQVRLLSGGR